MPRPPSSRPSPSMKENKPAFCSSSSPAPPSRLPLSPLPKNKKQPDASKQLAGNLRGLGLQPRHDIPSCNTFPSRARHAGKFRQNSGFDAASPASKECKDLESVFLKDITACRKMPKDCIPSVDGNGRRRQNSRPRNGAVQASGRLSTFPGLSCPLLGDKMNQPFGRHWNAKSCLESRFRNKKDSVAPFLDEIDRTPLKNDSSSQELSLAQKGEKELTSTEKSNGTPPMQQTSSPDFTKREAKGVSVAVGQGCFAAGQGIVKDRRKCKPRGVLTVDMDQQVQTSTDSEVDIRQSMHIPAPAVASVEWTVDEETDHDVSGPSSGFTSVSSTIDFCRQSFQRLSLSMAQLECFQEEDESERCVFMGDSNADLEKHFIHSDELLLQDVQSSLCTYASTQYLGSVSSISEEELVAEDKYLVPSSPNVSLGEQCNFLRKRIEVDNTVFSHFLSRDIFKDHPSDPSESIQCTSFCENMSVEDMDCSYENPWSNMEGMPDTETNCLPLFLCSLSPKEEGSRDGFEYHSSPPMSADMSLNAMEMNVADRSVVAMESLRIAQVELFYFFMTSFLEKAKKSNVPLDGNKLAPCQAEDDSGDDNSTLRGLTIDSSLCEDDTSSECSVNQHALSLKDELVDSYVDFSQRQVVTGEESNTRLSISPNRCFRDFGCIIEVDLRNNSIAHQVAKLRMEESKLDYSASVYTGSMDSSRVAGFTAGLLLLCLLIITHCQAVKKF